MKVDMDEIYNHFLNKEISSLTAQQYIYDLDRDKRFELFITLYTSSLHKNKITAFEVFKEAYCMSDNIYLQIQNSNYKFGVKNFLNEIQNEGLNVHQFMTDCERGLYDKLPRYFKIYRGMNKQEHESKEYGISWSLTKKLAEKYISYDKNNVEKGGLASKWISKKDLLSIFNDGYFFEVIYLNNRKMSILEIINCSFYQILNWKMKKVLQYKCGKITTGNNV